MAGTNRIYRGPDGEYLKTSSLRRYVAFRQNYQGTWKVNKRSDSYDVIQGFARRHRDIVLVVDQYASTFLESGEDYAFSSAVFRA